MTISLRSRVLGVLQRARQRYAGQRTIDSIATVVETLLRVRGDVNDSAVRVSDLEDVLTQTLAYHLETSGHAEGSGAGGGGTSLHARLGGLDSDDHSQYFNTDRGDARYPTHSQVDIRMAFRTALDTGYKELTYTAGRLDRIDIWSDSSKVTKLFTRLFDYVGTTLESTTTVDEQSGQQLEKNFTYAAGQLATVTEAIT